MVKPQEFNRQRVVRCETRYNVLPGSLKGPGSSSGVLAPGRVVWVKDAAEPSPMLSAFAENLGIFSVAEENLH